MTDPRLSPHILHIDDASSWRGGQHQVALLAEGLAERGVSQIAVLAEGPLAERLRAAGIEVITTRFRGELDWRAPRLIRRLAAERGINIIHAHTSHAHTLALRAVAGWPSRLRPEPRALVTRRVDFAVSRGWFSRRKYTDPRLRFIAISRAIREVLIQGRVPAERIEVVHSGVTMIDPARMVARDAARAEIFPGCPPGSPLVGAVGALTDHKGHRYLIEAAALALARRPDLRFVIMGEGELKADLAARVEALGIGDKFRLAGFVPDARLKPAALDLFVSSSHMEGLGTAILDAMMSGVPVVATAAGGSAELVREGETGWLAPPRDPAALAEAMLRALCAPESERAAIATQARAMAQAEFSAEAMVEGNLGVYRRLVLGVW